ncbi:hypothetical protein ACFYZ8_34360 [Streptomyces sp. NPDC001668]|uniref:hypothetical protein n=1 Tax=Streptomyces sp. NPDC001668 TaxID=3364598 RepID=UPI003685FB4B
MDIRDLWWAAGRLDFPVSATQSVNHRWHNALRRAATLIEPAWPKNYSAGPFTFALPTVALVLYAFRFDSEWEETPVEQLVAALAPRPQGETKIEDAVRDALVERGHDLDDDSQLSRLFRQLTEHHPPLAYTAGGLELTSADHWPGGTMMRAAAEWANHWIAHHHLNNAPSA